jgi:DNA-binding SARP family transcriptional activator
VPSVNESRSTDAADDFEFRLLGHLQLPGDPDLEPQPAALVAFFLLHPNTTFEHERLARVAPSLDQSLGKARRALQTAGYPLRPNTRKSSHHRLDLDPALIDVTEFRRLARAALAAQQLGDEEQALPLAQAALDLWTEDRALPELRTVDGFHEEIRNLDREREQVEQTKVAAQLGLGQHEAMIPELAAAFEVRLAEPSIAYYLMQAYYRARDAAAALRVFRRHRDAYREALGIDPHPDLVDLEKKILNNDRELLLPGHQPARQTRGELVEAAPPSAREQHAAWEIPDGEEEVDDRGRPLHVLDERLRRPERMGDGTSDVQETLDRLHRWAESEAVLGLFDLWEWDEPLPRPSGTTYLERFRELEAASEAWNYRRYAFERWQQLLANLPEALQQRVIEAAAELGLRDWTVPLHESYALGVALGGARRAPLCRTKWLELLAHRCEFAAFAFASSLRPIDEHAERSHTAYAPGATTEFDLMHHAACHAAGLGHVHDWDEKRSFEPNYPTHWWGSSLVRRYKRAPGEPPMVGIAAASEHPLEHRPRTPETLRSVYRIATELQLCRLEPGSRILLVTSPIYVAYQQIEALRILGLPFGLVVEMVGHPREWTASAQAKPLENFQLVGNYLQEIRSAIEACRRFAEDFPREAAQPVPGV